MRIIAVFAVLACLAAGQARAQPEPDQFNKLSLEALTATPPRGSGYHAPAARPYRHAPWARRAASHWHRPARQQQEARGRTWLGGRTWQASGHAPPHRASAYAPRLYRR